VSAAVEQAVTDHRGALVGLAYRMLGSVADAEDVVQEAFVRLDRHGTDGIDNVGGWLHRTTSRLCLDRLRSAAVRREVYVGPWLPEPIAVDADPTAPVEQAESLTMAFLVVLESLSPAERVAFVLHDVFGAGYDEVAATLDRSEPACRQLVARARRAVQARRPRFEADAAARQDVAERFLAAFASGDPTALLEVLAPDVVLRSDGGGVVSAARHPVHGADRVTRFLLGLLRKAGDHVTVEPTVLNGGLGFVARFADGRVDSAWALDVADGVVVGINAVRNPAKLRHLGPSAAAR
jgi:RNA polymerase sigma-70 factor, ECF subfamily